MKETETKKSIFEMLIKSMECKCESCQTIFNLGWNYSARYYGSKDQKLCQCEPFQSCPLCSKVTVKTDWLPISEMKGVGVEYWLLDKNNKIGVGYLVDNDKIVYILNRTPVDFECAEMCAENKPPSLPFSP